MKTNHTPGPWTLGQTVVGETTIKADNRPSGKTGHVCTLPMLSMHTVSMGEYHANAKLIAAAPELLEVAKVAARAIQMIRPGNGGELDTVYVDLFNAIKKATE